MNEEVKQKLEESRQMFESMIDVVEFDGVDFELLAPQTDVINYTYENGLLTSSHKIINNQHIQKYYTYNDNDKLTKIEQKVYTGDKIPFGVKKQVLSILSYDDADRIVKSESANGNTKYFYEGDNESPFFVINSVKVEEDEIITAMSLIKGLKKYNYNFDGKFHDYSIEIYDEDEHIISNKAIRCNVADIRDYIIKLSGVEL